MGFAPVAGAEPELEGVGMIVCESLEEQYVTRFSDGVHEALADTSPDHGGSGGGFNPHALLEASLGNCIAIVSRMIARKHAIPLEGVKVTVNLKRDDKALAVFEYAVDYAGDITPAQRETLLKAVAACPVHKTLKREMVFRQV